MAREREAEVVIEKVCELYDQISKLESLKPCKTVDALFTQLVRTCTPPVSIDVNKLSPSVQEKRSKLIQICGKAEVQLEIHYSTILASYDNPLHHLHLFPYYNNYRKLCQLEYSILSQHSSRAPSKIAFVGSGPLPLTPIVLASHHLPITTFHNYDPDPVATSMAQRLVSPDPDLSKRMIFHNKNILDESKGLREYDVVYVAALVGLNKEEKARIMDHLAEYMAPGALLMKRSAHGARVFLYPVIDPRELPGFKVLSVFHPTDEVINSVVIARKCADEEDPSL